MKKKLPIIITIMFILIGIGISFAYFTWQSSTSSNVTITAGEMTITYNGGSNITNIKLIPVSSKTKGESDGTAAVKTITASSTEPTYMDLNLTLDTFPTNLKHKSLVWELYKGNNIIGTGNFEDSNQGDVINLVTAEPLTTTTSTFKLYIWIDGNQSNPTTMMNQSFNFILNATATDNPNRMTVTFDANGGTVNLASKTVRNNQTYGSLPTPTKSGYTFKGWTGKNLVPEVTENNYNVYNHNSRTTSEFRNDNNINYIHFMGPNTTTSTDTAWYIITTEPINLISGENYNLNFLARSKNNLAGNMFFYREFYTGFYSSSINGTFGPRANDLIIKTIDSTLHFTNDGEWHLVNTVITIPSNVTEAKLVIGDDYPDIYGENSYIDITNVQLEEGSTATTYEPHIITSSTTVVQESNHTLKAIWE